MPTHVVMTPFRSLFLTIMAVALAVAGLLCMPGMAPEPDPVPRRWQLSIEPGPLRVVSIDLPSTGPRSYYFFTYKVTNSSGNDLLFAPSFDLATDHGQVQRSGREVPAEVTRRIVADLENKEIQDQISIVGMLAQGEENAKEGVVIWPANSMHVSELMIYAAGFSGEMRSVSTTDPKTGKTTTSTVRKALMLRFQAPGELRDMASKPIPMVEQRWIMR
jgi:hypothetical protein